MTELRNASLEDLVGSQIEVVMKAVGGSWASGDKEGQVGGDTGSSKKEEPDITSSLFLPDFKHSYSKLVCFAI